MKRVPIILCAGLISVLCLSGCGASLPQEDAEEQIPVYHFEEKPDPGIPYFEDLSQEASLPQNIPEHILTTPKAQKLFAAMGFNEFEEAAEENGKKVWRSVAPVGNLNIEGDAFQIVTAIRFTLPAGDISSTSETVGQFLSVATGTDISAQDKDSLLQLLTTLSGKQESGVESLTVQDIDFSITWEPADHAFCVEWK
ncbi:MAG: hypothetical protein HFE63_11490 [Clostridiales bacterium]|nr:hypothetical protein [Clostridiales bacterium]